MAAQALDREGLLASAAALRAEVARRIVGQGEVLDEILMALVAGGHALLVGVPGLAPLRSRRPCRRLARRSMHRTA